MADHADICFPQVFYDLKRSEQHVHFPVSALVVNGADDDLVIALQLSERAGELGNADDRAVPQAVLIISSDVDGFVILHGENDERKLLDVIERSQRDEIRHVGAVNQEYGIDARFLQSAARLVRAVQRIHHAGKHGVRIPPGKIFTERFEIRRDVFEHPGEHPPIFKITARQNADLYVPLRLAAREDISDDSAALFKRFDPLHTIF